MPPFYLHVKQGRLGMWVYVFCELCEPSETSEAGDSSDNGDIQWFSYSDPECLFYFNTVARGPVKNAKNGLIENI